MIEAVRESIDGLARRRGGSNRHAKQFAYHMTIIQTARMTRAMAESGLHFVVSGSDAPVVLIHGVGADGRSWDEVIAALGPGFRTLKLDLAGHGRSPPIREPYSLERFADDVLATMDRAGMDRAHVVGFSLGGLIAQQIALAAPERVDRLGLLAAVAGRTDEERA